MIIDDGMGWTGSYQTDALWEKDFAQWSGWMVCVNNYYVGTGMASRNLSDGDEIRVRYTLAGGKDIGQYGNEGVYGNVQVIMAKNGKRNRKIKNREKRGRNR